MDEEAENEKRRKEYAPTYISPWERAMKGNEELTSTMKAYMPGPIQMHREMPLYKSFNRSFLTPCSSSYEKHLQCNATSLVSSTHFFSRVLLKPKAKLSCLA